MSNTRSPHQIAFCISDLEVGGAERCFTELVTRIDRRRFSPLVFCLKPRPQPGKTELVDRIVESGIEPVFFDLRHSWQISRAVRRLKLAFRRLQPSLVQTFLFHANCVGAMAGHRAGIRRIVAGIRVADPRSRFRLWLERKLTRRVSNYICVSQAVAAYSAQVGKLPPEKLAVISNGVDIDRFQRAQPIDLRELRVSQDRKVLTYVGRLDQQKRVERLVRMFSDIADAIPEYDLIIVGDGPQRNELVSLAGRSPFADRIRLVGFRDDVPAILAASDMLLLASQWEGMPNVLLEAMAAGVPLVTFNVEGTEELLDGIAATQFVEANDDEADTIRRFGDRVVDFARDQNLANRIAQSNIEIAKQFSIPQMVSRYEQLYARLID